MISATIASDIRIPTPQLLNHSRQAIEEALTITNPAYADALKHGRYTGSLSPDIEYFRHEGHEMVVPRGFGLELSRILGPDVEWIDHRRVLPEIDLAFTGTLRDYQQEAVASVLKRPQGVLEASTGAGKTVCALAIIAARKQPTLILVHNVELLHQWQERIRQFLGVEAGQAGAGKCDVRPVTVGIVNSVRTRLEDLVPHFGHIVVDECHRCPSAMFTECASAFDANYLLGLSATL